MILYDIKFLFISIMYISLINKSAQNIEKRRERLENAIKFMISSLKGELKNISLLLEYKRYHILINNFRMLKPLFSNDIQFIQEENIYNEKYIKLKETKITYIADLSIKLLSNPYYLIKDKAFFIDTNFNNITFQIINDYNIEFISSNISFIKIVQNNAISNLDYFNDFNNSINNIFNEEGKNYLNKFKNIFIDSFSQKILEIEKNINLLTYDMILIINNQTSNVISDMDYIIDFTIDKILTKNNFINLNKEDNIIKISNLTIFGKYTLYFDEDIIFNITCEDNNEYFVYERKEQNTNIEINIKKCKIEFDIVLFDIDYTEIKDDFDTAMKNDYPNKLKENADNYYKQIFEL